MPPRAISAAPPAPPRAELFSAAAVSTGGTGRSVVVPEPLQHRCKRRGRREEPTWKPATNVGAGWRAGRERAAHAASRTVLEPAGTLHPAGNWPADTFPRTR